MLYMLFGNTQLKVSHRNILKKQTDTQHFGSMFCTDDVVLQNLRIGSVSIGGSIFANVWV